MKKVTLHFHSLCQLTAFSKGLACGYLLNTNNLTITGKIPPLQVNLAIEFYNAAVIETTEKVYSYDCLR